MATRPLKDDFPDDVLLSLWPGTDRLRGALQEAAWIAGHLALYPTGLFPPGLLPGLPYWPSPGAILPRPAKRSTPQDRLPVVLVHGLADNRSIFSPLRRRLRAAGFTDVHAANHNPVGGDIRIKAELLGAHIEEVCERTGAPAVHVVGHSLGGLIARYHAQRLDPENRVRTVVTLGTPHHGTLAALLLRPHPLVRQMCPDSPVIAELAEPAPDCRARFYAFWGDIDPLIIPRSSGALDHPDLNATSLLVPGAGHLALSACAPVVAAICTLLAAPPAAPPQAESPTTSPTALAA